MHNRCLVACNNAVWGFASLPVELASQMLGPCELRLQLLTCPLPCTGQASCLCKSFALASKLESKAHPDTSWSAFEHCCLGTCSAVTRLSTLKALLSSCGTGRALPAVIPPQRSADSLPWNGAARRRLHAPLIRQLCRLRCIMPTDVGWHACICRSAKPARLQRTCLFNLSVQVESDLQAPNFHRWRTHS